MSPYKAFEGNGISWGYCYQGDSPHLKVFWQALRIKALPDSLLPVGKHLRKWQEACMYRAALATGWSATDLPRTYRPFVNAKVLCTAKTKSIGSTRCPRCMDYSNPEQIVCK